MKKLLPIILMLFSVTTFAQNTATTRWTATSGLQDTALTTPTCTDANGNIYLAGFTFNPTSGADILIVKLSSMGDTLWSNTFSSSGMYRDQATAIAVKANGDVIAGGFSYYSFAHNYDAIILSYDSTGTQQFVHYYDGGYGADAISAISIDGNAIYATGASTGSTTLFDYITLKVDSTGIIWSKRYDNGLIDVPFALVASDGYVIVTGGSQSSLNNFDYCLLKYNETTGNAVDTTRITGTGFGFDRATAVVTDIQGYVYITGAYATISDGLDYKTIKIDQQGNIQWVRTYDNASGDDIANSIGVDYYGNVYVTGQSRNSSGNDDYCTILYDNLGNQQWVRFYDNGHHDKANKLIVGDDNNVYITGESSNGSNKDFATLAYNLAGDTLYKLRFNGIFNGDDIATGIEKNGEFLYVSGQIQNSPTTYQYITIAYGEATYETIPDPFNEEAGNTWFYPNQGQLINSAGTVEPSGIYYSQNQSPSIYLNKSTASYVFSHHDNDTATADTTQRVDMIFVNSTGHPIFESIYEVGDQGKHYLNFYLPQCPNGVADVHGHKTMFVEDLHKGIDLYYTSNAAGLKHYFVLKKGQSPSNINMLFRGADSITHSIGTYTLNTSVGSLKFDTLIAYEIDATGAIIPNTTQPLDIFADTINGYWHFVPFAYNESNTLVIMAKKNIKQSISPENFNLGWSTYWGGEFEDEFTDIKVDNDAIQYVSGNTTSPVFPIASGQTINSYVGNTDAILIKVNELEVPQWLTYIGGSNAEKVNSIALTNLSLITKIYGVGYTYSSDLPVTDIGQTLKDEDMMIFEIDADGYLQWLTYYGYYDNDWANDVALDVDDNIYVVGHIDDVANADIDLEYETGATIFTSEVTLDENRFAYVVKFDSNHNRIWASFVNSPGSSLDATSIVCDLGSNEHNVFITGYTAGTLIELYPTENNPSKRVPIDLGDLGDVNDNDIFVTKYSNTDFESWNISFGGNHADRPTDIAVDIDGNVFGTGFTYSGDISLIDVDQTTVNQDNDFILSYTSQIGFSQALIYKLDKTDGSLLWNTYYGGVGNDIASHLTIDKGTGNIYVSGTTSSQDIQFPSTPYAQYPTGYYVFPTQNDADLGLTLYDGFLLMFNAHCDLQWSTYFGEYIINPINGCDEIINSIYSASDGKLYFCGSTNGGGDFAHQEVIPLKDFDPNPGSMDWYNPNSASGYSLEAFVGYFDPLLIQSTSEINKADKGLSLYPNPTQSTLNINYFSTSSAIANILVYDAQGTLVLSNNKSLAAGNNKLLIDTETLPKGMYLIAVSTPSETLNKKFIKN